MLLYMTKTFPIHWSNPGLALSADLFPTPRNPATTQAIFPSFYLLLPRPIATCHRYQCLALPVGGSLLSQVPAKLTKESRDLPPGNQITDSRQLLQVPQEKYIISYLSNMHVATEKQGSLFPTHRLL